MAHVFEDELRSVDETRAFQLPQGELRRDLVGLKLRILEWKPQLQRDAVGDGVLAFWSPFGMARIATIDGKPGQRVEPGFSIEQVFGRAF